jgi:hypothetical protein
LVWLAEGVLIARYRLVRFGLRTGVWRILVREAHVAFILATFTLNPRELITSVYLKVVGFEMCTMRFFLEGANTNLCQEQKGVTIGSERTHHPVHDSFIC